MADAIVIPQFENIIKIVGIIFFIGILAFLGWTAYQTLGK